MDCQRLLVYRSIRLGGFSKKRFRSHVWLSKIEQDDHAVDYFCEGSESWNAWNARKVEERQCVRYSHKQKYAEGAKPPPIFPHPEPERENER